MASVATPTSRKRSRSGRAPLVIVAVLVVIALIGGGVFFLNQAAPAATGLPPGWQVVTVNTGTIDSTVSATGNVEPQARADLRFEINGVVTDILVEPGDAIEAGQPLARIDTTDLQLRIEQAAADLKQAQADYADLLDGASEQEIAEARARVTQAQAQFQQTASSVSQADIAAARSDLEQAQARMARLQSGVASDELARSAESLKRAQINLDQARTQLASAKEAARVEMEAAANTLRNRQDEYSRIYWQNQDLVNQYSAIGRDLPRENLDQEAAALRAVQDAEALLEQRRIAYEDARQNEITTLQVREAELASAQAAHDKLLAGPRAEELAEARAQVERAQARLAQLTGAQRSSELAAQRSNLEIAQLGLERLMVDPSASALATREAAMVRADIALKQAQRNLELATLTAPFAATVARIDMRVGEPAGQTASIAIADLRSFHVDVPIDELDVAQVRPGQPVRITLDALPDAEIGGSVTRIAPLATRSEQGTTSYAVTVAIDAGSGQVRPGMTAVVQIVTQQKDNALLAPRRAVQTEAGATFVLVPTDGPPDPQTGRPASERRPVTLGLSNNEFIEITSGLQPGERILVQDVVSTLNPFQN